MVQLPVIIVLTFTLFVGAVSPELQSEGHDSGSVNATTNAKNVSESLSINETKIAKPPVPPANKEEVKLNQPKIEVSAKNESISNGSTPIHMEKEIEKGKQNCTSADEKYDMTHCKVKPSDNDEIIEASSNTTEPNTSPKTASNETVANNTKLDPPHGSSNNTATSVKKVEKKGESVTVFPINRNSHDNATSTTEHLVSYVTGPSEIEHSTNGNVTDTDPKPSSNHTEVSISSIAPLLADKVRNKETDSISESENSTEDNKNKGMPSGIIVLVTAISFAIAGVIAYVGTIAWRRYVEYRYGHRELLVNELEFDTNDLRHFEL